MAEQLVIRPADLSAIENGLRSLRDGVGMVQAQVHQVGQEVTSLDQKVLELDAKFEQFLDDDRKAKALQLAETRLVKLRQQLETEYGHYSEVRRRATGILQATDIGIVRQETITTATEQSMFDAPRYWLAPCLVGVAAWIADDKPLADRAVGEAMRRDANKTSLFYALTNRRMARFSAGSAWLEYYFSLQDPTALDREAIVLIDGLASGIFGAEARSQCSGAIGQWLEMLSERVGFVEEQKAQWERALLSKAVPVTPDKYPYLKQYSPVWPTLENSLNSARSYRVIAGYFQAIFNGEILPSPTILVAVDDLLDKLVSRYDDEELPLRQQERLQALVIEENGDEKNAQKRADLEKGALDEKVSFTQLLTNAAMHPETSHASRATQRYAVALSRDWIAQAHSDIVARNRAQVPGSVSLNIENWQGLTQDGTNEQELMYSLYAEMDRRSREAIDQIKIGAKEIVAAVIGVLLLFYGLTQQPINFFPVILALACFAYFGIQYGTLNSRKEKVRQQFETVKQQAGQILRGALAEMVDWRHEYREEDARARVVSEILEAVSPEQYMLSSHDAARTVVKPKVEAAV